MEWVKIDFKNLPSGEVLAANFKPKTYGYKEKLLGHLDEDGSCEDENTILENCSHYIDIHKYDLTSSDSDYEKCPKCGKSSCYIICGGDEGCGDYAGDIKEHFT